MKAKLRTHVAAIMLLAPVAATFVGTPAFAQQRATVAPTISSMAVNSDAGVQPGATLRFQVAARANASQADIVLGDSGVVVALRQQGAGSYTGSYVVRNRDRIDPSQVIAVRVAHAGGPTIARNFSWPQSFQALAMGANPPPAAPAVAAGPMIERFVMRPVDGRIDAGEELRFRLVGAPGATATMDIPGVLTGAAMTEVRPGVYEGLYTVRRRDNPDAFSRAVATLRTGTQRTTARVIVRGGERDFADNREERREERRDERRDARRDDRPPQITDMTPAHGERVSERGRTQLSAKLSDEGTGIDVSSVRLRLAGRDVTNDARVTSDEINYRSDLNPGRYTAELAVKDNAGNMTTKSWTFDVIEGDRPRVGSGPLPLQIVSHAHNATVDAGGTLTLAGRTAPNAVVRVQIESVASIGGLLGVTQPVMDQTVQADRNGNFSVSLNPGPMAAIPGGRWDVRMTATSGTQTAEERITLNRRS